MSLTRLLQLERLVWELSVWKETKQCQVHIPAESHNPLAVGCDIWGIFCKIKKKNCKLKYPLTFYHLSVTFILKTVWQCRWSSGAKALPLSPWWDIVFCPWVSCPQVSRVWGWQQTSKILNWMQWIVIFEQKCIHLIIIVLVSISVKWQIMFFWTAKKNKQWLAFHKSPPEGRRGNLQWQASHLRRVARPPIT